MRILLVSNGEFYYVGAFFRKALEAMGHQYAFVDERDYFGRINQSILHKVIYRVLSRRPLTWWKFNRDLIRIAWRFRPEIVLVTMGAHISPDTLVQIKEGTKAILVNYATDDPFNPANSTSGLRRSIRFYDLYACTKRAIMADVKRAGCPDVCFVPFGYEPSIHFPDSPSSKEECLRFGSDVVFVGGADQDRLPYFKSLVESIPAIRLDLYGGYWDRDPYLRPYYQGRALGRDYRLALRGAKVAPGLVRRANRDGHAMRTFEIPACGAFMLAERTEEHMELFEEGKETAFFDCADELVDKIRYYLKDDADRARLAEAAYLKITRGKNTYKDRLEEILRMIKSL